MRKFGGVSLGVLGLALGVAIGGAAHAQSFTNWADVLKPGATVSVNGVAQEFTYNSGPSGVTAVAPPNTNMSVSITETLNAQGEIASLQLQNVNRTVNFVRANGDVLQPVFGGKLIYGLSTDWARKALAADALVNGWKYQSFGVWVSGLGMANGSAGAASVGAITAGTSVPQTGSATFFGLLSGIYNDAAGQDHLVAADMGLKVNFGAHSADFWSTNTVDNNGVRYAELDITGFFNSLANHPALFGQIKTARLFGTTSAQFYGPNAEEVGGVFTMTPQNDQGLERLAAAFGGKRGIPVTPGTPIFTSWGANLQPGRMVYATGISQEITITPSATGGATLSAASAVGAATFTEILDGSGAITTMQIAAPNRTIILETGKNDVIGISSFDARLLAANNAAQTTSAIAADPTSSLGWNYQSFGAWQTLEGPNTGSLGAISVGAATQASAIPTTGAATFRGQVGGAYVDAAGTPGYGAADMTLAVNFAGRSATFASGDLTNLVSGGSYAGTAISGTLTYAAAQNQLTGTLSTARLSGGATGRFYGPSAQEVGGTFVLAPTGSSVERLVGGFGAKR